MDRSLRAAGAADQVGVGQEGLVEGLRLGRGQVERIAETVDRAGAVVVVGGRVRDPVQPAAAHLVLHHHVADADLAGLDAEPDDAGEQPVLDRAVMPHRLGDGRPLERQIGVAGQRLGAGLRRRHPGVEVVVAHRAGVEGHLREARARVMRRAAGEGAGIVGDQVQLGLHPGHGIDHAAKRGDRERVHHRRGAELEVHRPAGGNGQLVHRGDAELGIDEQPFPVERDGLDLDRGAGVQRAEVAIGIEPVGVDPGHRAKREDNQDRHAPDHHLEGVRMGELGVVIGAVGAVGAISQREVDRHEQHRHDHDQHQQRRDDQKVALLSCDPALGRQNVELAAGKRECASRRQQEFR
ncbi:hypothetical protein SDC9_37644 [bioreactor metagenome]|uniref:Uncharacterized protein n=1 Tax=bioreactor metagenome TaxID=1076179 RepID=A0A644VJJ7_9ZZZZ